MGDAVTIRIDDDELRALLKGMQRRGDNLRPLLTSFTSIVKHEVLANFRKKGSHGDMLSGGGSKHFKRWRPLSQFTLAGKKGTKLQESNKLRASIGTVRNITSTSLEYGTNLGYAAMQHFGTKNLPGGVLRPKNAKALTIPFPGVTGRASDYPNTFLQKSKKGNPIIFQSDVPEGIRPLFMLMKAVKIPGRPFMTLSPKGVHDLMERAADYMIKKTLAR